MNESIKKLFSENQEIIQLIDLAVANFRIQNYDKGLRIGLQILDRFAKVVPHYVEAAQMLNDTGLVQIDIQQMNEMLQTLLDTQERMDYILLSDLYELQLGAYIADVQQAVFSCVNENELIDSADCDGVYSVEFCTNGEFTLAKEVEGRRLYLHSNHKPMQAANELAKSWFKEDKSKYIVFGFGRKRR